MDASGLEAIYLESRDALLRFLRAHGAGEAAEDLLHQLRLRLRQARPGPIAQPLAYLYRAANTLMLDRYREDRPAIGDDGLTFDRAEDRLAALGGRGSQAFRRHRLDGAPQRVVAAEFGVDLATIERDLFEAAVALIALRQTITVRSAPAKTPDAPAVRWVVRADDPAFADWPGFEAWLAADVAHAEAYHAAAAAEAEMVDLLRTPDAALAAAPPMRVGWRPAPWFAAVLAAAVLLVVSDALFKPAAPIRYETAPRQHREITLADGTRIALGGDTRLKAAASDPRAIRLEHGKAVFAIRHDPSRPFTVTVGDATIAGIGTRFDIARDAGTTRVSVTEGTVVWNRGQQKLRLDAGRRLRAIDGTATLELAPAASGATIGQRGSNGAR